MAGNWSPSTVPNGPSDIATFSTSQLRFVNIDAPIEVAATVFQPGASTFSIALPASPSAPSLTLSGSGVINNSSVTQSFVAQWGADFGSPTINFKGTATAGSNTSYTAQGGTAPNTSGGMLQFFDSSTAGEGTFVVQGSTISEAGAGRLFFFGNSTAGNGQFQVETGANGGALGFSDDSSASTGSFVVNSLASFSGSAGAGSATFVVNGSATSGGGAGFVLFNENASAENASFTGTGGAVQFSAGSTIYFSSDSDAANATLVAYGDNSLAGGATIYLADDSSGGQSVVKVYGRGNLDVDFHTSPGASVGSVEGDGAVFLGGVNLSVGSNDLDTIFSGLIQDGGTGGGTGGSLMKIGAGQLTLSGANLYTGGTTISEGVLILANQSGSATGTGSVQIDGGVLSGQGRVTGAIVVGDGSGSEAIIRPGTQGIGRLGTKRSLSFRADSTYDCEISSAHGSGLSDQVIAKGITINPGAQISLTDLAHRRLATGATFILLDNRSDLPIAGIFSNLAEGTTVPVGRNTFIATYAGGDGNDLALTVQ
jgi:autotransporter-associated beta strand protein